MLPVHSIFYFGWLLLSTFAKVCGFKDSTVFDTSCFIDMYLLSHSILTKSRETEMVQK